MSYSSVRRATVLRCLVAVVTAVAVLGASGCQWFHRKNKLYEQGAETRPLEVPPDLDRPNTDSAMQPSSAPTQSVTRSSLPAAASAAPTSATGFTIAGERDEVFEKVGAALGTLNGVTVASKAQLLGTYDVNYQGANFLVRVTKTDAGVYVSAVDPRGMPATEAAPVQLIAALKSALGG